MSKGKTNSGTGGGSGKSSIIVTAPTGSTVWIENQDGKRKDAGEKNGVWTFKGCDIGTWTVNATLGEQNATQTVEIKEEGQMMRYEVTVSYVKIYGIQRDITQSSPEWVRTDDAVGFEAVASVGTQSGHSDFDNCYPWSGIERVTFNGQNGLPNTGDVMVKIPKFWFKRWHDGNVEHIQIADKFKEGKTDGFVLHPAFNHANVPTDYIYVGAYKTNSNIKSVSGATVMAPITRSSFRNKAKGKGNGWGMIDISTFSAIQMLILLEFANNNVQSEIGRGCVSMESNTAIKTGSTDNVPNLTGSPAGESGKVDVVFRGIEGIWGNDFEWIDGLTLYNNTYYVCNDPSKYGETISGYSALSFGISKNVGNKYIIKLGLDAGNNHHVMLPIETGNGSSTTYFCDAIYTSEDSYAYGEVGGTGVWGDYSGLFYCYFVKDSANANVPPCSRLIYIPQEVA